MTGGPKK